MSLNLGFAYFVDSAMQTAVKRFSHKKLWNVVLHAVTSWAIAWASLCIGGTFLPFSFQLLAIALKCLLCILQEPTIGFIYTLVYGVMAYYALFVYNETTVLQAILLIVLCLGMQLSGHVIFEGELPQRLPTKDESALFQILDLANEFFFLPFHFSLTLMVRCDLLPILRWRSDAALHKLITSTQELKYGKKSP
ncbi:uncharacterized protein [Montipora capricornis]|uniref:uncharacterized protein n=1 Tax=Montipora capricornis TaxID=246305 RepID=UPI0035F14671